MTDTSTAPAAIAGLGVVTAIIVIFALFVPMLAAASEQVPEPVIKRYVAINTEHGIDVIFPRVVRDIVKQVLADPQVASVTADAYLVLVENNFEGFDELPGKLTFIVTGERAVYGSWQTTYTIIDSRRSMIVVGLDGIDIKSIEINPITDSMRTLAFDKKRQDMIKAVMQDSEVRELVDGKGAYVYAIRDFGVATFGDDCPYGSCAIVSLRQVHEEEYLSATVNTRTGKVVNVGYSDGWLD